MEQTHTYGSPIARELDFCLWARAWLDGLVSFPQPLRITSATVFTAKVMRKSIIAPRKACGKACCDARLGSSTAMFAESVRMPEKIFRSITGVLPVAITTIIVSPIARPRPIITAEKMPAEAVGSTTLTASATAGAQRQRGGGQCAGHIRERIFGDGKMIGMTAKPMMKPTTSDFAAGNRLQ
jgi:hypothetical protein